MMLPASASLSDRESLSCFSTAASLLRVKPCCQQSSPSPHLAGVCTALQEHASALTAFKARIVESGLQIPQELIINGDVDATLYRFLRARKYDVHLAFAMLESE